MYILQILISTILAYIICEEYTARQVTRPHQSLNRPFLITHSTSFWITRQSLPCHNTAVSPTHTKYQRCSHQHPHHAVVKCYSTVPLELDSLEFKVLVAQCLWSTLDRLEFKVLAAQHLRQVVASSLKYL